MEERTGLASLAGTLFVEFAWNMSGTWIRSATRSEKVCRQEAYLTLIIGRTAGTVECSAHVRTVPHPMLWASRYRQRAVAVPVGVGRRRHCAKVG